MENFKMVSDLIEYLTVIKEQFGDLPLMLTTSDSKSTLVPFKSAHVIRVTNREDNSDPTIPIGHKETFLILTDFDEE